MEPRPPKTQDMQNSSKKRFNFDLVLIVMAVAAIGISILMYFSDDQIEAEKPHTDQPIGQIAERKNDVRRKTNSGFSWIKAEKQQTIFDDDSFFTGPNSTATLSLFAEQLLTIEENSLIVLRVSDSKRVPKIELEYGSLTSTLPSQSRLLLAHQGRVDEIINEGAEARIQCFRPWYDPKKTQIRVYQGQITLRTHPVTKGQDTPVDGAKTHDFSLSKDKFAEITQGDSLPEIRTATAEIKSPAISEEQNHWLALGDSLDFEWRRVLSASKFKLEFSRERDFKNPIGSLDVPEGEDFISVPYAQLPQGSFYWRLRLLDPAPDMESSTPPGKLNVFTDLPPLLISPSEDQELTFFRNKNEKGKSITFHWNDSAGSSEFEIQIAKDPQFNQLISEKTVTATSTTEGPLPEGNYYWRIMGTHEPDRAEPPWSGTRHFAILEEVAPPKTPSLADLQINFEIPRSVLDKLAQNRPAAKTTQAIPTNDDEVFRPLLLTWDSAPDVTEYELEIDRTPAFSNPERVQNGKQTSFLVKSVRPGKIFARVRAKGLKGSASAPSAAAEITVKLPAPELLPTKKGARKKNEFALSWKPLAFASAYEILWSQDREFKTVAKFRLRETYRILPAREKRTYYAQIRALDGNGSPISDFSPPLIVNPGQVSGTKDSKQAKIAKKLPSKRLPAGSRPASSAQDFPDSSKIVIRDPYRPELIEPAPGISIVSVYDAVPFFDLKWQAVPGASGYEIEIGQDADFEKTLARFKTKRTSLTVKKDLPEGRIFWRVRSLDANLKPSEWSQNRDLYLLFQ